MAPVFAVNNFVVCVVTRALIGDKILPGLMHCKAAHIPKFSSQKQNNSKEICRSSTVIHLNE